MKNIHPPQPPEQIVTDLAHLAWCALVSLRLAQHDGQALSNLTEHTFLVRWLAVAQKQRRFPRSVTPDIESLLKLGRHKGISAGLQQRLEYLLESCSSPVSYQSDLFRLTYAIETLKAQGWLNAAVADHEWDIQALLTEYDDVSALLVRKSDLVHHFNEQGQLTGHVEFLVNGDTQHCISAMQAQGLPAIRPEKTSSTQIFALQPASLPIS